MGGTQVVGALVVLAQLRALRALVIVLLPVLIRFLRQNPALVVLEQQAAGRVEEATPHFTLYLAAAVQVCVTAVFRVTHLHQHLRRVLRREGIREAGRDIIFKVMMQTLPFAALGVVVVVLKALVGQMQGVVEVVVVEPPQGMPEGQGIREVLVHQQRIPADP
jgi:hypothetical protein